MPAMLRAIIFDLGGTLMYERENWHAVTARADEALTMYLREKGLELNLSSFPFEFRRKLNEYFAQREKDLHETSYSFVLRALLDEKGYNKIPDIVLRNGLDRLFAVTQTNWALEPDALETLRKLEGDGYRIGLISNAGDDQDVQQLTRNFKITRFFDFIITSAACGYRKPHRYIFELALSKWRFSAAETIMVGDNPDADMRGAQGAGIHGIWIQRGKSSSDGDQLPAGANAAVSTLADIPAVLDRIQIK